MLLQSGIILWVAQRSTIRDLDDLKYACLGYDALGFTDIREKLP